MFTGTSHPKSKLQAIESLHELSNTSPDQRIGNGRQRPSGIKVPKQSLLSSASQTLSPRTPCQPNSSDSKRCVNCQCTSTPLWRKDKSSGLLYCNACGIYFKNHGKHRPLELIEGLGQPKLHQLPSGAPDSHAHTAVFTSALVLSICATCCRQRPVCSNSSIPVMTDKHENDVPTSMQLVYLQGLTGSRTSVLNADVQHPLMLQVSRLRVAQVMIPWMMPTCLATTMPTEVCSLVLHHVYCLLNHAQQAQQTCIGMHTQLPCWDVTSLLPV